MVYFVLVVLGLCLGSFVNALVWRLHELTTVKSKQQKAKLSILNGRSMCVDCKHRLEWYDLIPVLSWLSIKGKCRYCHKPISWQYPVVEIATASLFVLSYIYWPSLLSALSSQLIFGLWLGVLVTFMALLVYDIKWMILPDKLVGVATFLAVLIAIVRGYEGFHIQSSILSPFWGVLCIAGLFYVLFQVSKGKWIGGGDVKLGVPLGIIVGGPVNALLLIFLASLLGSIAGMPLLFTGKQKSKVRIPFGPFLIMACIIVYLLGNSIIAWYMNKFLLGTV